MSTFAETMARMAVLTDEQMERSWHWRDGGEDLQIRDGFHRTLEAENAQATVVAGIGRGEIPAALSLAQRAAGDLCGLLAGQPDEVFDRQPAGGEWPLREVMKHTIETEVSFRVRSLWSVTQGPAGAQAMPDPDEPLEADVSGDAAAIIGLLLTERAVTDQRFDQLSEADLETPSTWAGHVVDVRFRLHRPASHLIEHTNQCEKVLHALGQDPGEARQLVRAIWAARGAHERHSDPATLRRLDEAVAPPFATLA